MTPICTIQKALAAGLAQEDFAGGEAVALDVDFAGAG